MASQAPTMSKLSKAKARLILRHPFFATLLLRTQVVVTTEVELAAADGEKIYYNPNFLELCSIEDTMSVLAHEVGHNCLMHSLRLGSRNPDTANQAMDHALNLMLEDQGFKAPSVMPGGGWLADPQYKGMHWERIYDMLRRNPPPKAQPQPGDGQPGSGQPSDAPPSGGQPGNSDPRWRPQNAQNGRPGAPQPGRDGLHGDVLPTPAKTPIEQAQAEQRAKQRVAAAANMARMAGKLKGELARMVDDFLESKVHWTDVLRDHMLKVVKARDSWVRRNRRYTKVYLPTRHERKMGPIIFIPDTSSSMWGDGQDLDKVCSEMAHCAVQTKPEHIRVVWADTQVSSEQVFEAADFEFRKLKPTGGGGTNMRAPLAYVAKYDPQVVVLMTDGETPWPDKPCPYPVICICTTNAKCPDWMEVIRI